MLREKSRYFKAESDHHLVHNSETRKWVEIYAQDQNLFFTNFAKAHVALSELNCTGLMGEMNNDIVDGGYVEKSRYAMIAAWFRRD